MLCPQAPECFLPDDSLAYAWMCAEELFEEPWVFPPPAPPRPDLDAQAQARASAAFADTVKQQKPIAIAKKNADAKNTGRRCCRR